MSNLNNYESQQFSVSTEASYETCIQNSSTPISDPSLTGFGLNFGTIYEFCASINVNSIISQVTNLDKSTILSLNLLIPGTVNVGLYDVVPFNNTSSPIQLIMENSLYRVPLIDNTNTSNPIDLSYLDTGYAIFKLRIAGEDPRNYTLLDMSNAYYVITYRKLHAIIVEINNIVLTNQSLIIREAKRIYKNDQNEDIELDLCTTKCIQTGFFNNQINGAYSITYSYTEGFTTKTKNKQVYVCNGIENVPYNGEVLNEDYLHYPFLFDIYYPAGYNAENHYNVVIFVHGGSWTTSLDSENDNKPFYNQRKYTDKGTGVFLLLNNCIYVDIDYRLLVFGNTNSTLVASSYVEMLQDIDDVVGYIKNMITSCTIYLMGYSAGGHLSLLYKNLDYSQLLENSNDVIGVISEAGPTLFNSYIIPSDSTYVINHLATGTNSANDNDLNAISPYYYVSNPVHSITKTLLVYSKYDELVTINHGCKLYQLSKDNFTCYDNCDECNTISNDTNNLISFVKINYLSHSDMGHLSDFNDSNHLDVQAYYTALSNFLNNNS
ncbi:carboxylesterase family protein [bacterium]|nr:carboxylesterase family protein [bacterium]